VGPRTSTIAKALLFHAEMAAWLVALLVAIAGKLDWAVSAAVLALGAHMAGRLWSRHCPVPMPYFMRWVLLVRRGPHSPTRLRRILQPRNGERILEIGPGVGVHALSIAAALRPDGVLDVLDVQPEMLDDLVRRAARAGLTNIVARQGDAQRLPYRDSTFDAAYLISVLGEVPDAALALRELRRVLKPGGRLVIGEMFVDPDFVSLPALRKMATDAGFVFDRRFGPRFAYGTVFRPIAQSRLIPGSCRPSPAAQVPAADPARITSSATGRDSGTGV
jgi:SAM-dependent methyltransferase